MAVAVDTSASQWAFSHSNVAFITSPTVTAPAGSQIWVMSGWDTNGNTLNVTSTPSATWNVVAHPANPTSGGDAVVAYLNAGAGWTGTVTVTPATFPSFSGGAVYVMIVTGMETTPAGTVVATNGISGPPGANITTIGTGSLVVACATNWTGAGTAWSATTGTNGANQSFLQAGATNASDYFLNNYQFIAWRRTALVNAGTYTLDLGGTSGAGDFIIAEIRAAAGGGGPAPKKGWGRVTI